MALAPPPVYIHASETPLSEEIRNAIHIYVNGEDCVPSLSLASVFDLLIVLREVQKMKLTCEDRKKILGSKQMPNEGQENFALFQKLEEAINAKQTAYMPLLHPVENINFMYQTENGSQSMTRMNAKKFSERIVILDKMLMDHIQPFYQSAIERVIE